MMLRYPTTSFAASYEDLTGGLMVRFEKAIINFTTTWMAKRKLRAQLAGLTERELNDIGINHADIDAIVAGSSDLCSPHRGLRS